MGYKDILVYLDPTPASTTRLNMALHIAAVDRAHVIGVDASTDEAFLGDWRNAATDIESGFWAALQAEGVEGEFHLAGARGKHALQDFSTPADLVIAPSPSLEFRKLIHPALPDDVVMQAGSPVIVVPTEWPEGGWGKTVVVAWNGRNQLCVTPGPASLGPQNGSRSAPSTRAT